MCSTGCQRARVEKIRKTRIDKNRQDGVMHKKKLTGKRHVSIKENVEQLRDLQMPLPPITESRFNANNACH